MALNPGAKQYTHLAHSAKLCFMAVGDITTSVNKDRWARPMSSLFLYMSMTGSTGPVSFLLKHFISCYPDCILKGAGQLHGSSSSFRCKENLKQNYYEVNKIFHKLAITGLFSFIFVLFKQFWRIIAVDFSGIRTQIVGKKASTLTTLPPHSLKLLNIQLILVSNMSIKA